MIRHDAIKNASRILIGKPNRLGDSGKVVRKIIIRGEGETLFEMDVLSRDGILPVDVAEESE